LNNKKKDDKVRLWLQDKNAILVDRTEDVKCRVRRQCYILHYSLNLFSLVMREFFVTDRKIGEKLCNFKGKEMIGNGIKLINIIRKF